MTSCLRLFLSELESSSGSEKEEAGSGNLLQEPRPRTTRPWTPLSLFNSDYVAVLKEREQTLVRHDFIKENIVSQMHIIIILSELFRNFELAWSEGKPGPEASSSKIDQILTAFCFAQNVGLLF